LGWVKFGRIIWMYKADEKLNSIISESDTDEQKLKEFVSGNWGKMEYDIPFTQAMARYRIKKAYTDYKKMAQDGEIDAVSICTPNASHFPIAREMIENGKNVLVEKSMGVDVSECETLIELAEKISSVWLQDLCGDFIPMLFL